MKLTKGNITRVLKAAGERQAQLRKGRITWKWHPGFYATEAGGGFVVELRSTWDKTPEEIDRALTHWQEPLAKHWQVRREEARLVVTAAS